MSTATDTGSTGIFGESTAPLFRASRAEIVIDRQAKEVWSVLTDLSDPAIKLWNPEVSTNKHISGQRAQENEFILVTKKTQQAPFYMRTIRIVPNQQRVLRADAVDGSFSAFVDHTLYELAGGKTKVVYSGYMEFTRIPADQVKTFNFNESAGQMMDYLNHIFVLLKKVVEEKFPAR